MVKSTELLPCGFLDYVMPVDKLILRSLLPDEYAQNLVYFNP